MRKLSFQTMNKIISSRVLLTSLLVSVSLALLLTGCASKTGPKMIEKSFSNYGEAIHSVVREELLLNVVRRYYHESPQFVTLSGISHTRSVSTSANLTTNIVPSGFGSATGVIGGEQVDFPTFSITPLQGPEVAEKLHQRLPLKMLPHLTGTGYPTELVLTLLAQEIGGIRGVEAAAHNDFRPGSPKFGCVLKAIGELDAKSQIKLDNFIWEEPTFDHPFTAEAFSPAEVNKARQEGGRFVTNDDGKSFYVTQEKVHPSLWIDPKARSYGPGRELMELLDLESGSDAKAWILDERRFSRLGPAAENPAEPKVAETKPSEVVPIEPRPLEQAPIVPKVDERNPIVIQTRSFYGILNLLSHGVQVPEMVEPTYNAGPHGYGKAVVAGLAPDIANRFTVHFSCEEPECVFLSVKSRNGWFYIKKDDYCSQQIFNVLYDVYNLQIGVPIGSGQPSAAPSGPPIAITAR